MRKSFWNPRRALSVGAALFLGLVAFIYAPDAFGKGELDLRIPDLSSVKVLGTDAHTLLLGGMGVCVLGMLFGLFMYQKVRRLPVHKAMLEVSELIYETCKTYL